MNGVCQLCGYEGEVNTPANSDVLCCLECFCKFYSVKEDKPDTAKGEEDMSWNDVMGTGGGKTEKDELFIGPNSTKLVHILLAPGEEPVSYWTHFIPDSTGKTKGKVVICPGKAICPACKAAKFRTKRVHAINVWDYESKSVKILEQGNQVMQQLSMINDQFNCKQCGWDNIDISIRRIGDGTSTQYVVIPIPVKAPFDKTQLHGLFPIASMKIANSAQEVEAIINGNAVPEIKPQQTTPVTPQQVTPAAPAQISVTPQVQAPQVSIQQEIPNQAVSVQQSTMQAPPITQQGPEQIQPQSPVLPFGKYKGQSLAQIYTVDQGYVKWCADNLTDPILKAEAAKVIAGAKVMPRAQTPGSVLSEGTEKILLINEIQEIFGMDPRYKGDYTGIVNKMREATKSATFPNGKTLLPEYTLDELKKLKEIIK